MCSTTQGGSEVKKTIVTVALAAMVLSTAPLQAQQTTPAVRVAQAQQAAPSLEEFDKQMAQIQENLKKMQEQMDKIRQTQNPQERQRLLQEHGTTMQGTMTRMHGMWGPGGMMGCCAGSPMMGGHMMSWKDYQHLTPEQMKQRQYMMGQYMSIQQMMMDHMMQHQYWMGHP
jgi:hypothetical protein